MVTKGYHSICYLFYDVDSPMGYIDMVNTAGLVNVYNYVIPIGHIEEY
jgi:hypothetical protein